MRITESQLRKLIQEVIKSIPIRDAPVTLEFKEDSHEGFYVSAKHPGVKRVGYISVIPYWDDETALGMDLPKRTMKGHEDIEIYTVDIAKLEGLFQSEGLGTQMYKFLIANLSKLNIALVPAEWGRATDRKGYQHDLPVGERGTSHDALRVWRSLEVPAFYPEWNPDDFRTFQSTRKRGFEKQHKPRDKRVDGFEIE